MSAIDVRVVDPPMPQVAEMPGLRFRHFRGVDLDVAGMAAANQAARSGSGEIEPIDVADVRATYEHLIRCDPDRDICILEMDGTVAGYARVWWDDLDEGSREYFALRLLRPEVRIPAVERALLAWTEGRRRMIAAEHRAAGDGLDRPAWLATEVFDNDHEAADLLRSSGYDPYRRFASMIRPDLEAIADAPMPEGLEIRPIVPDDRRLEQLFEAEVEAFRDHFGARDSTEEDRAVFFGQAATGDLSLWVIAFDGDEVAGAVRPRIKVTTDGIREGWLDPVYTRRPWRRRGLARALIAESLRRLRDRGADRSALGVDLQNPNQALSLYESCGFRVMSSSTAWRKPLAGGAR